ncbi:MAG: hypothetical protein V1696_01045 [Candidatus Jorgensenbacteria bacterium]
MHPSGVRKKAQALRKRGFTHREIVKELGVSLGSAYLWTHGIKLSKSQKRDIQKRRHKHVFTEQEKEAMRERLKPHWYKNTYKDTDLIGKIQNFYSKNGRIPLKREFNSLRVFRVHFGSWNNAIRLAGFEPNPVLFSKKFTANDGHPCDSFTEKVIDDWLYKRSIRHKRHVPYFGTKMTADFSLGPSVMLEFFGLAGVQKQYDKLLERKRQICRERGIHLIEVYPRDLFPRNQLSRLLKA